ncbi:hypothetical protein PAXINDRAFT_158476 [Paxillus involutus ATCC 200175]|uniref:Uncharacterized protein n=1 Tax=Paxillus involutus ATCC 200175 TaxID=664439 RepID=A0A0C9T7X9_PAXIN|nr:hypothetical protein PAXINDRAFT_158476 [Paxillus involutus ATCC 200175]
MQWLEFTRFLRGWQDNLQQVLETDPGGFMGWKYVKVAGAIPNLFPDYGVLQSYHSVRWTHPGPVLSPLYFVAPKATRQFANAVWMALSLPPSEIINELDGPEDEKLVHMTLPACVVDKCQHWILVVKHESGQRHSNTEWSAPDDLAGEDPYSNPAFTHTFDCTPNQWADKVLALFLMYKGFHQNLDKGMVEGIRAAFKDLWDNVDGDTYHGQWNFNHDRQQWEGNPAESAEVNDIISSLKHKASSEDGDIHSQLAGEPTSVHLAERTLVTRHLEQIAFNATAWTLWTRCFELVKVKHWHVTMLNPVPINHILKMYLAHETLVLSDLSTHFDIHLKNHKG